MDIDEFLIVLACAALGFGIVFHFLTTRDKEREAERRRKTSPGQEDGP